MQSIQNTRRPLNGIRVVDLSTMLAGPIAASMLADQGADVIKVEAPGGDTSRRLGPTKRDLSGMFIAANRGKRCIAIDLKQAQGRDVLRSLLAKADVLVDNMRPQALARLGFDTETLATLNPRLIHASITGFGPDGPYADRRAYDAVIQALSGMCAVHAQPAGSDPLLITTTLCDKLTALTLAQAISSALYAREQGDPNRRVQVSMLDAAVAFQWPDAMYNHIFLDEAPPPAPEFGISHRPWKTRDGAITTNTPQRSEVIGFCTALGWPEIADDPLFSSAPAMQRHGQEFRDALQPLLLKMDTETAVQKLAAHGVPVGRVNQREDVLCDPQVLHNRTLCEVDNGSIGRIRLPAGAARFGSGERHTPGPAGSYGEHNKEVLSELGYESADIAALVESGVLVGG